ncbi:RidA family protein [Zavarzinia sp. CC-PAN008]|uniref:RidA family protein n=1 Tax=Zavarzinia sp. CC-PAN008 TaxID=3243332 RepID=UPI003F748BD1
MLRKFNPDGASTPNFYSHGVEVPAGARLLFIAGQVGQGADGAIPPDMAGQAALAVANLKAVLAGAGMGVEDVVKYTIYLTDEAMVPDFLGAAAALLSSPPPATTLLFVKALASPALFVEIEAVAAKLPG